MNDLEKDKYLHKIYYDEKYFVGRDLLFHKVSKTNGINDISRRYIEEWLKKQKVHQLYTNKKPQTSIRPIISKAPGQFLQMDLIDFSKKPSTEGYKYILNVIDIFSRKVWLEPLYNKTIADVIPKLNSIVEIIQKDYKIIIIQSDNGAEFNISFPTIRHIQSQPHTPQQNGIVCGTIKKILFKYLYQDKEVWDEDILLQVENVYNDTLNTSTGKTPDEAYVLKPAEQNVLTESIKKTKAKSYKNIDTVLQVGDKVRVIIPATKIKTKGEPLWSKDIYTIKKVIPGNSIKFTIPRYQIELNDVIIKGNYALSKLLYIPPE